MIKMHLILEFFLQKKILVNFFFDLEALSLHASVVGNKDDKAQATTSY